MQNDPHDPFLAYALALEHYQLGNVADAVELLECVHNDNPDYVPTYYQLASIYIEQNQPDKARALIEEGKRLALHSDAKTYAELVALLAEID